MYGDGINVPSLQARHHARLRHRWHRPDRHGRRRRLLAHDHTVTVLARSDASARAVETAGATPLRGSLADLDTIRGAAERADGVVHLAFANDFSSPESLVRAIAEETAALTTMGEALVGTHRPLVTVAGTPWVPGRASTEDDPLPLDGPVGGRGRTVDAILALADRGAASAIRLPRTVHRDGEGGFAGLLTQHARTPAWPATR